MRIRRRSAAFFILTLVCCATTLLYGQQAPAAELGGNPMTLEQHLRLVFLIGRWEEEVTYAEAPASEGKVTARWTARPAMGLYVRIQYEDDAQPRPYRAFGVLTYDREERVYRMWWFDNVAGVGEYRGNFIGENHLVLEHHGKREGKAFRERIRFTRLGPNELRTTIEQAGESGEFRPYLEAVAHRATVKSALGPVPSPQN